MFKKNLNSHDLDAKQASHPFHTKLRRHWIQTFIEISNSIRGATSEKKLCPKHGITAAGTYRFGLMIFSVFQIHQFFNSKCRSASSVW